MNNFFKIYFFLFAVVFGAMYGIEENENTCYKRLIRNQPLRMLTSAVIGGLSAMGLKYSINNNKFLSSLRLPEKIKNATDTKYFLVGSIAGIGLYEWVNRFMDRKKKAPRPESKEQDKIVEKIMKITYVCPTSLFMSCYHRRSNTQTAKNIEDKIGRGEIKKYHRNKFHFNSINEEYYNDYELNSLKNVSYAAALYLIEEQQKEEFEKRFKDCLNAEKKLKEFKDASPEFKDLPRIYELFKKKFQDSLGKSKSLLYELYKIKPISTRENLWCYALPLQYVVDEQGQKSYSLEISSEITPENMQEYAFQLPDEDAQRARAFLDAEEFDFF